jgi:uncharacterized protein YegP (UPF0339 family)
MFNLKAATAKSVANPLRCKHHRDTACRKGIDSVIRNAPVAPVENQTVEGYETEKHPKFEVYRIRPGVPLPAEGPQRRDHCRGEEL